MPRQPYTTCTIPSVQGFSPVALLLFLALILASAPAQAEEAPPSPRVLAVMSYHPDYPWHMETRQGLEESLPNAEIRYFYLDTKNNLAGGPEKARQAYALYESFKPDAVVAAEDNTQSLFVLPYLKDKVATPVFFCGVNDDASKYGYPAGNVTGIVEKKHFRQSISLAQLIAPEIRKIAVLYRDTPSNQTNIEQLRKEAAEYTAAIVTMQAVATTGQLTAALETLQPVADALIVLNLTGVLDDTGNNLSGPDGIKLVTEGWHKPTIGASTWEIEAGLLCAVAKIGQEQGRVVGDMILEVMGGKPVSEIPLTSNRNGRRIINVSTAARLGIALKPIALLGAELVR